MNKSWTCPFCKQPTTVTDEDRLTKEVECHIENVKGNVSLVVRYIVCPNPKCKELYLDVVLFKQKKTSSYPYWEIDKALKAWNLIPESTAKSYSTEIIPKAIVCDYEESCKIRKFSPKASASLARRTLQGMIRDFYKKELTKYRKDKNITGFMSLKQEITAIKDVVDGEVWDAIDAVRNVGNIGAHMEEDVNFIIDVEPGEADKLIELIEMLIEEWYINRHKRQQRLKSVVEIANNKKKQQNDNQKNSDSK